MDVVSSIGGTSDESSCDISTAPSTPASSPLFFPSHGDDITRLTSLLSESHLGKHNLAASSFRVSDHESTSFNTVRNVCFIGAGYVGGPTAAVVALHNPSIRVEVLDRDQSRIDRWMSSHLPIHEDGLNDIVRVVRDGALTSIQQDSESIPHSGITSNRPYQRESNLFFTTDAQNSIGNADIVFLAVNTPTKTFGLGAGRATNMTALDGAAREVALRARPGTIIVEKSTVPCGTARRIRQILDELRPGVPFEILSNPEFLSEGTAVKDLMKPERVIIGSSQTPSGRRAAAALASVYSAWVSPSKILEINTWSSELSKLVANAMLAQRLSSINSISAICEQTGADIGEIAKSIGADPRIGPQFLKAGLGFGGSCFRKDISSLTYLAESLGLDEVAHYWDQVNTMNMLQRRRFAKKVIRRLNESLVGKKIALLGFAFKKNTGDTRESQAVDVIDSLLEERPAEIAIFDPYCREQDILREVDPITKKYFGSSSENQCVKVYADPYQACSQAQAVLVISDCDQFKYNVRLRNGSASTTASTTSKPKMETTIEFPTSLEKNREEYLSAAGLSHRLTPLSTCTIDCSDCKSQSTGPVSTEAVEWARIAYNMKEPKWVFDGRAMLNVEEIEKLGVRVDAIGRATRA